MTSEPNSRTLDLTGLPESVVRQVTQLVEEARRKQAEEAAAPAAPQGSEGRQGVIGMFAHLGVKTPTLDEFEQARREMWANFPREFPDPSQ